ncbi:hypothetical protein JQ633_06020 [Bradyrhizobium tropiciagri]|uniref:hypothetical protein n=1 Tax=Bradyrhizobium tropiciagri TaxID=312253 RepID=UPI001BA8203B|nr:hypothetical protein [Bradyrhizobium tropiciagri]MBR0869905.1 hypothetical protein [Bradyrhizobium tropiciagri]
MRYLRGKANRRRLSRLVAVLAALLVPPLPASAGVLSGREFQNLLAGGPEGTTILFQGGTDKIFYSPTLKNRLRLSPELGPNFLKQKIMQNTVAEGVFVGTMIEGGKWRTISGIAGIAADVDSGHGVLTLLQTFPEDTSVKAFQKRDRLYAVVIVEDAPSGVVCRRSHWEKLFAAKGEPKLTTVPCEFTVGNTVTPTSP